MTVSLSISYYIGCKAASTSMKTTPTAVAVASLGERG